MTAVGDGRPIQPQEQVAVSTRPASGSEHLFSHLWEMDGIDASHGFKVGLGTLAAASLYEVVLDTDLSALDPEAVAAAWPRREEAAFMARMAHSDPRQAGSAVEEILAKYPERPVLLDRLQRIRGQWGHISSRLRAQVLPATKLRQMLTAAGCPTTPESIGLTRDQFKDSFVRARTIRRRYTILGFALETGLLHTAIETLFARGGFWQA